jgi:hypothetical protein
MQNMWQVPERSSDDFKATTWHPKACRSLKLLHHTYPYHQKSIIQQNIDYIEIEQKSL